MDCRFLACLPLNLPAFLIFNIDSLVITLGSPVAHCPVHVIPFSLIGFPVGILAATFIVCADTMFHGCRVWMGSAAV